MKNEDDEDDGDDDEDDCLSRHLGSPRSNLSLGSHGIQRLLELNEHLDQAVDLAVELIPFLVHVGEGFVFLVLPESLVKLRCC